ncbi:MAG: hypothetical protein LBQ05_00835 [Christensenellaceae bacterium]|nr:hypothetical protein [Christensenellaceae bacterium]
MRAFFSGGFWLFGILGAGAIFLDLVLCKIVLPKMSKRYEENNKEMVDLTTLAMAEEVKKIKKERRGWF